jgi:hypothetical protein
MTVTTSTILDEAEQRIAPTATTAQAVRQEQLAAMYQEIGRPLLDQAKVELPKLEQFIAKDSRPFLARVASIGQRAKNPLPQYVQAWLTEMVLLCDSVPNTIRSGIEGYAKLSVPIWTDGKTLDINERARLIAQLRFCLRNWDGVQGRLTDLRIYTEQYIRESNWPAEQPGSGAPHVAA